MSFRNRILFILGGLIISYIVYFRLIYIRVPRDLYTNISFILLILYLAVFFIFFFNFYKNIYLVIYKKKKPNSNNYFFKKLIEAADKLISLCKDGLTTVESVIMEFYPHLTDEFARILHVFFIQKISFHHGPYLSIVFDYVPRACLALAFFYDVVINNYFQLFFTLAPLALIPLIYSYFCYFSYNVYVAALGNRPEKLVYEIFNEKEQKFFPIEEKVYILQKWRECYTSYYRAKERYETDYLWNLKPYQDLPQFETYRINLTEEQLGLLTDKEIRQIRMDNYLYLNQDVFYPFFFHYNIIMFNSDIYGPRARCFIFLVYIISWLYLILFSEVTYLFYI